MKIKVIDEHPGKWHDGAELVLFQVTQLSHFGVVNKGDKFFTGLKKVVDKPFGMFAKTLQPLQIVVQQENGEWIFTMYNAANITQDQIEELFANGTVTIGNIQDIYPVYQIDKV